MSRICSENASALGIEKMLRHGDLVKWSLKTRRCMAGRVPSNGRRSRRDLGRLSDHGGNTGDFNLE